MNMQVNLMRNRTILQGEFYVSADPQELLTTLLGSCVAVCMTDPVKMVGGMNHFLLPYSTNGASTQLKYGAHSMELLINGILKLGAERHNLQAKLFGGARMSHRFPNIGMSNAEFAKEFLRNEGIKCQAQSLGGDMARRIKFVPTTGSAQQMLVPNAATTEDYLEKPKAAPKPPVQDLTLF